MSGSPAPATRRGAYFFLSYAHVSPLASDDDQPPGEVPETEAEAVRRFFTELSNAVRALVGPRPRLDLGLFDQSLPVGEDSLSSAIGAAEVLVPMYSQRYLEWRWPKRECETFLRRLRLSPGDRSPHVQPVLWMPLDPDARLLDGTRPDELEPDIPAYAKNGLFGLTQLGQQRNYKRVIARLAARIVEVARDSPIGVSTVSLAETGSAPPDFTIAVMAPTSGTVPSDRPPAHYGHRRADWRPFNGDEREAPVAVAAAHFVERVGLMPQVVDAAEDVELAELPTMLLVDPWAADRRADRALLRSMLGRLHESATVLVITDTSDAHDRERGDFLLTTVKSMLTSDKMLHAEIDGMADFQNSMPELVAKTRRRFIHSLPRDYPPRPRLRPERPRLGDLDDV